MESEVFKGPHSITASGGVQPLISESESDGTDDEDNDGRESGRTQRRIRKLFQAKVQKLLAVRWFTKKRGLRLQHLRRHESYADMSPSPEEEAMLGKVLSSRYLMQKTMEMLQSFQREIYGVEGFFDELGVLPGRVRGEDMFGEEKKESLMQLAVKAIHQAKSLSLRIFYNDHMKQQEQELKVLKQNYEKLTEQFAEVRQDYLQEVTSLRDQVRIRGAVDSSDWIDGSGGDVVYFFDPAKALSPKETGFVLRAVKEKLMMILEQNPRIGGAVDLGQLEKLKELQENRELEEMKAELLKRSHELVETQRSLRKLQEEMEAATPSKRGKAPRFERMMEELEEKLLQLRQDASLLKRQLHAESKERHHAEESLKELQREHQELCQRAEDLEQQESFSQSEVRALRKELEFARAQSFDLQDAEIALKAKIEATQQSHAELIQVLARQQLWKGESLRSDPFEDGTALIDSSGQSPEHIGNAGGKVSDTLLLEEAHQQVIDALKEKDLSISRAEDFRRENAQLRRELARQSQGVLLMEAESNSQNVNNLASFLSSLQKQLTTGPSSSRSPKGKGAISLAFPELEKRLVDANAEAGRSLKAVLQALRKPRTVEPENLQLLQQESLRCQQEKQLLEKELFELRLKHIHKGLGSLTSGRKTKVAQVEYEGLQSLLACSLQFLESMSQNMQELTSENTLLRESLLSFSSSLSQASSMVSGKGNQELESILTSITANAECAVPAVFSRLFNNSRKVDPRLEQQAQERRQSLTKSLIYHLSEDRKDSFDSQRFVDHRSSLRHLSSSDDLQERREPTRPRVLANRSSRVDLEELPATHRPPRIIHQQRSIEEPPKQAPMAVSVPRSFLDEDAVFNSSRSSWGRQYSGSSEVSQSSKSSKQRTVLGITSLEFQDSGGKAKKLRVPRRAEGEGLMLPQVPQAQLSPVSPDSGPLSSRGEADDSSDSSDEAPHESMEDLKPLTMAIRPPAQDSHHFLQSRMELQDQRLHVNDVRPPESWPSRMRNALTSRRLSHMVGRPEVTRGRRASVS